MDGRGECCEESWRKSSGIEANRCREACVGQGGRGFDCRGRVEAERRLSGSERVWRGPETKCDRRVQASTLRTYRTVFWLSLVAANETGEQEVAQNKDATIDAHAPVRKVGSPDFPCPARSLDLDRIRQCNKSNIVNIHMYRYSGDVRDDDSRPTAVCLPHSPGSNWP